MSRIRDVIRRVVGYAGRHGFRGTLKRAALSLRRMAAGNWFVLYRCDLTSFTPVPTGCLGAGQVERKRSMADLDPIDRHLIVDLWNPEVADRQINERFQTGASLWLFKLDKKIAAYGWTLDGKSIEPHFIPLNPHDVHLFDFFVLPDFRGRRINIALMNHILSVLASEGKRQAFIEAAQWNAPQLASLKKSPFQPLGRGRKSFFTGKNQVILNSPP